MCEHDFLSHWDIAGRKPYQRYSDFAYGQHVSEAVFGFDVNETTDDEVRIVHVLSTFALVDFVLDTHAVDGRANKNCLHVFLY